MKKEHQLITDKLEGLKCENIRIYDVTKITPLATHYIVASARTGAQLDGVKEAIIHVLKENEIAIKNVEHKGNSLWCLIDCYDFIIDIFESAERERRNFDQIFEACPVTKISDDDYLD